MDETPSGGRPADAAAIARDLVDRLSAISASLSSGLDRPGAAPPPGASGGGPAPDFGSPRAVLENGARFVSPHLPGDAPLRPLKALLLRILRIVTRDQTVFNSAVAEALRGALVAAEGGFRETAASLGQLRAESEELSRREAEARRNEDRSREAGFRAVGAALHETQLRTDGLERDRDRLSDLSARHAEALAALEKRIEEKYGEIRLLRLEWTALRAGLQSPGRPGPAAPATPAAPAPHDPLRAGLYVDFEEAFRGSEEEIRRRQEIDVALFRGAPGPVADLGCGRGEFLEGLRAAGLPAVGCDANPVMAARARGKGLEVDRADLFEWLAARADGSLGGVTAYQVVEHLPASRLFDLVELAAAKLAPGGVVLLETVNPESAYAMKWFWMDLTHVRPVPAPSLARLLSASGFRDVRIDWRSPVPASEAPPPSLEADPGLGPVVKLLFGPQDYAAIGRK
ncbi:MAG TPA: methyltransferase domain-containing protein [Thermoanaerobaculia bacterium]|nr:methyltransferase domain-containing protein [Thermoanaerobaculia bacterium]